MWRYCSNNDENDDNDNDNKNDNLYGNQSLIKQAPFLSRGRKLDVNILRTRTKVYPRFSNQLSLPMKRYLTVEMW